MTIKDLLDVIDYNRESECEKIQLVGFDSNWDDPCDEVLTSSFLLLPFYSAIITCMEAVAEDIIRVDIDWKELDSRLHIFGWDKDSGEND